MRINTILRGVRPSLAKIERRSNKDSSHANNIKSANKNLCCQTDFGTNSNENIFPQTPNEKFGRLIQNLSDSLCGMNATEAKRTLILAIERFRSDL